ncbi:fungal hydrophobin-domain-containing protein [Daedaleopsis nitida]|nr:fungal hydrophobin-domain-containing protein [Daedaleopsis nitida]
MFSKLSAASALAILAAATSALGQCATGTAQCCQSTDTAGSKAVAPILGALGIVVQDVSAVVGLGCSPISVVGVGSGDSCGTEAVCCDNTSLGGLIGIGCAPIST